MAQDRIPRCPQGLWVERRVLIKYEDNTGELTFHNLIRVLDGILLQPLLQEFSFLKSTNIAPNFLPFTNRRISDLCTKFQFERN